MKSSGATEFGAYPFDVILEVVPAEFVELQTCVPHK